MGYPFGPELDPTIFPVAPPQLPPMPIQPQSFDDLDLGHLEDMLLRGPQQLPQPAQQAFAQGQSASPLDPISRSSGKAKFGDLLTGLLGTMKLSVPTGGGNITFDGAPMAGLMQKRRELSRTNALAGINEQLLRTSGVGGPAGMGYLSNDQLKTGIDAQQGTHMRDLAQNMGLNPVEGTYDSSSLASVLNTYQAQQGENARQQAGFGNDAAKEQQKFDLEKQAAALYGPQAVQAIRAIKMNDWATVSKLQLPPSVLSTLITASAGTINNREDNAAMQPLRDAQTTYLNSGQPLREAQTQLTEAKTENELNPKPKPATATQYSTAYKQGLREAGMQGIEDPQEMHKFATDRASQITGGNFFGIPNPVPDVAQQAAPAQSTRPLAGSLPQEIQGLPQAKQQQFLKSSKEAQQIILQQLRQAGRR